MRNGSAWPTEIIYLPLTHNIGVGSFSRNLNIYDGHSYDLVGSIQDLPYAPLTVDVWIPPKRKDVEFVAFGDVTGQVNLIADFKAVKFLRDCSLEYLCSCSRTSTGD